MMLGETRVFDDPRLITNEEIGTRLAQFIGRERVRCFGATGPPSSGRCG